jgi:predicted membrane channel-forming protein YqfA (hemolysin III family)
MGCGCRKANRSANEMNKINSHLFAALAGIFAVLAMWHSSEFEPEKLLMQIFIGASLVSCFLAFATAMFEE